jgi:hypothetical protein
MPEGWKNEPLSTSARICVQRFSASSALPRKVSLWWTRRPVAESRCSATRIRCVLSPRVTTWPRRFLFFFFSDVFISISLRSVVWIGEGPRIYHRHGGRG